MFLLHSHTSLRQALYSCCKTQAPPPLPPEPTAILNSQALPNSLEANNDTDNPFLQRIGSHTRMPSRLMQISLDTSSPRPQQKRVIYTPHNVCPLGLAMSQDSRRRKRKLEPTLIKHQQDAPHADNMPASTDRAVPHLASKVSTLLTQQSDAQ